MQTKTISTHSVSKANGSCLKKLEIFIVCFECNRNSYLRPNLEVKKGSNFCVFLGSNFPLLDTMLKICWILLCIENEQRPCINRTHDETYLSRNCVCFHKSIDFFGQAIFWAGFKEARTYIYACWLTLVIFLNLLCCGSIVQYWEFCISCLPILFFFILLITFLI